MPGVSVTYANHMLDSVFGSGTPATIYFALCTVQPTSIMTGAMITEPTAAQYNGYARVAVDNTSSTFPAAQGGTKSNGIGVNFPQSLGGASSPVQVPWFALCDEAKAGNLITFGELDTPLNVVVGVTPAFAIGALTFTES